MAGRCDCSKTCSCAVASTESVTMSGTGSTQVPFRAAVRLSGDGGNIAQFGTDGGVLVRQLLLGPDGVPLVPDAGTGEVQIPVACILDYNGNPIEPGLGGCLQLPTSGAPPDFGCGLTTDEVTGELLVNTSGEWPTTALDGTVAGGTAAAGTPVVCDPVSGELRGAPEHTSVHVASTSELLASTLLAVATIYTSAGGGATILSNPSPSRSMTVLIMSSIEVDAITQPGSGPLITLQERLNGGAWTTLHNNRWPSAVASTSIRTSDDVSYERATVIGPGDAVSIQLRAVVEPTSGDLTLVGITCRTTMFGVTR